MGWTVSVSWNAQNDSTDVDVSSPPPDAQLPASSSSDSTAQRKLVPLDEWRRRVTPSESEKAPAADQHKSN